MCRITNSGYGLKWATGREMTMFSNAGFFEWMVIALIALLLFGHKLPAVARSLGSSVNEFKKGAKAGDDDAKREAEAEKAKTTPEERKIV